MRRRPCTNALEQHNRIGSDEPMRCVVQVHLGFEDSAETTQPLNRCYLSEPNYFKPFYFLVVVEKQLS
jgi:hypothetical protein